MKELFISQATYLKRKTSENDENGKVTFCSRAHRSRILTTEKEKLKVKLWSQIDISNLSMFLFLKDVTI